MRPKQRKLLSGLLLGTILLSSAGIYIASTLQKEHSSTLSNTVENLKKTNNRHYVEINDGMLLVKRFKDDSIVASQSVSTKDIYAVGYTYYVSNVEFFQLYKNKEGTLFVVHVDLPNVSWTKLPTSDTVKDGCIDEIGIHLLADKKIIRMDWSGENKTTTTLEDSYDYLLRHKETDLLVKGQFIIKDKIKIDLLGEITSVWKDDAHLFVISRFGESIGNHMIVKIRAEDLYIKHIAPIPENTVISKMNDIHIYTNNLMLIDKKTLEAND